MKLTNWRHCLLLAQLSERLSASSLGSTVLVCALAVAGCGPSPTQVVVNNTVLVAISDGPSAGRVPKSIDLSDKRIGVALAAIEKHLGGTLRFEIDSTLVPKFDGRLHDAFVEALETIVTSLDYVAQYHPEYMGFAGPHLRTLRWVYNPSRRSEVKVELDITTNHLEVPVAADAHRLLEDSLIATVFDDAWDKEKERRYAHSSPDKVALSEHEYYLDYLRGYHPTGPNATPLDRERSEMHLLGRLIDFYPYLRDPKLVEEATRTLVYGGRKLQLWYAKLDELKPLTPELERVHQSWIVWLNKHHAKLSDVQLRDIGSYIFTFHYQPTPGYGEGVDVVSLATPRIRSWIDRSKAEQSGYGPNDGANDLIVCPADYDKRTHTFSPPNGSCNGRVYTTLAKAEPNYRALIALITREDWLPLTQTATLNVLSMMGTEVVVDFWEALANNPRHARAALVALAEFNGWGPRVQRRDHLPKLTPKPFVEKLPQWWKRHPNMRPELLYLLTTLGHEYEGSVRWPKLPQYLGTRLTQDEVAGFLSQSPETIWHLRNLVYALGDGWSRSKMMIPELERFLNEAQESGSGEPSPYYVTERCVEFLCLAGTRQDLAALDNFLRERGENYPSERRYFDSFISQSPKRICPAAPAKEKEENSSEPAVFFGD